MRLLSPWGPSLFWGKVIKYYGKQLKIRIVYIMVTVLREFKIKIKLKLLCYHMLNYFQCSLLKTQENLLSLVIICLCHFNIYT